MWAVWAQDAVEGQQAADPEPWHPPADHDGQWYGEPSGKQVWVQSSYVDSTTAPANTGLEWNATNKNIPLSGFKSPLFYSDPRVGLIYDLFGSGKTILRAGFGAYRYQDSVNEATTENIADGPKGIINFARRTPSSVMRIARRRVSPPAGVQENCWLCGNSVGADLLGDDRTPIRWTGTSRSTRPPNGNRWWNSRMWATTPRRGIQRRERQYQRPE